MKKYSMIYIKSEMYGFYYHDYYCAGFSFFADVPSSMSEKPVLKIRSKVKEAIRVAKDDMERRLKEELKLVTILSHHPI